MHKKADALPTKVIVAIILILIVLVITILFATGTLREIFAKIAEQLGIAQQGLPEGPRP